MLARLVALSTRTGSLKRMKPFTQIQERGLLALSIFGLIVPNGVFLYFSFMSPAALYAAFNNPIALVFIGEAFLLMLFFAWMIRRSGLRSPGWLAFVLMSIVGSMAFSVPAFLYLASRKARSAPNKAPS
jgi:hypothetical protein